MRSVGAVRLHRLLKLFQDMGRLRLDIRPLDGLGQEVFVAGGIQENIQQAGMAVCDYEICALGICAERRFPRPLFVLPGNAPIVL